MAACSHPGHPLPIGILFAAYDPHLENHRKN